MVQSSRKPLTLQEFLSLPQEDVADELIEGQAVAKMSPKRLHASVQKALIKLMDDWAAEHGHFYPEWATTLKRRGEDWVPVPDLTYISFNRLPADWDEDAPCPLPPDLAIEIISPEQTFGAMVKKAIDYLQAGVLRVWVVDTLEKSITVFFPDAPPQIYTGSAILTDPLLAGLELRVEQVI